MGDLFEDALLEAEVRKAEAEAAATAANEEARADAAEAILTEAQERAALLLPPAEEAVDKLQLLGRPHVTRGKGATLAVHHGSPPLPLNMGLWGCDRPWHRGRRGGWAVHTQHPRSDDAVPIFVPLIGSESVYKPMGVVDLQDFANQGHRESTWNPGEGLPRRHVVDASTSLRQFIDVIADYIAALG